jgi:hypothetical protein
MKRLALVIMVGIVSIPTMSQINGLSDYKRTKSYDEMDANEGTRFYYKPNNMAYLGYSCYIFSESDKNGNYLLIKDDCSITEKNVMQVYDELCHILKENGLQPDNFVDLTGTDELNFDNVYNAVIVDGEPIFVHYSIGVSNLYFSADNYSVELTIMERKAR